MSAAEFWNLFDEDYDYPSGDQLLEGVPVNTLYSYVSSYYLNGFINYIEPIKAIMVERYSDEEELESNAQTVAKFNEKFHSNFSDLPDDVLIAAESNNSYWFFWYDKDCSDCQIGRLSKDTITKEDYLKLFNELVVDTELLGDNHYELKLAGWVTG